MTNVLHGLWHRFGTRALFLAAVLLAGVASPSSVFAQSKNRAPGFETLPKGGMMVIMPTDIELFEISGGGVHEPKADWTQSASRHFRTALEERRKKLDMRSVFLSEREADETAEVNALHGAVARAIAMHHFGPSFLQLPTKEGKLDWSLGEAVQIIKKKTGGDYAFFSFIRDSYVSGARVATMIALAMFGVGVPGGAQIGYASLVDLNTGQVVWFNRLARGSGDLREAEKAAESLDALLENFPATK